MPNAFDWIEAQVLSLPESQRIQLLDQIIASLDRDGDWLRAWDAECARREADADAHPEQWLDGLQTLQKLKARTC